MTTTETTMATTVLYYDSRGERVVRSHSYPTPDAAHRAIARAAKRGQIAAVASKRTAADPPTVHH